MWNCEKRVLQAILLILAANIQSVQSVCHVCQPLNSVACHGETGFSLCINGTATRNYTSCPDQYVCTSDKYTCYPKETAYPSCWDEVPSQCGVCNVASKTFSCISHTKIAFCFGIDSPDYTRTANCPTGLVCDIWNPVEFCSNATYVLPSCNVPDAKFIGQPEEPEEPTTTEESTTTVSGNPHDPNTICADAGTTGDFPFDDDTTCTQYIKCYYRPNSSDPNGILVGCPAQMYFDPVQRICTVNKPESCDSFTTIEESTTTVEIPPRDANAICADGGISGVFPYDNDIICTHYILCHKPNSNSDTIIAYPDYKCPSSTPFFNPVIKECTAIKPAGCA